MDPLSMQQYADERVNAARKQADAWREIRLVRADRPKKLSPAAARSDGLLARLGRRFRGWLGGAPASARS